VTIQLLLFADSLAAAGLQALLEAELPNCRVSRGPDPEAPPPQLVIWQPDTCIDPLSLALECQGLQERWQPAPLLLLLSPGHRLSRSQLLALPATGLLEAANRQQLLQAVQTLIEGGRVLELMEPNTGPNAGPLPAPGPWPAQSPWPASSNRALGLGSWLLLSGLEQIDAEIALCRQLLQPPPQPLARMVLRGRLRELAAARRLLLWLWGPIQLAWSHGQAHGAKAQGGASDGRDAKGDAGPGLLAVNQAGAAALSLQGRSAEAIWQAIHGRLRQAAEAGIGNGSSQLLAIEGLAQARRVDLLLALLEQLALLRRRLAEDANQARVGDPSALSQRWQQWQAQLRQQAVRAMASSYVQLPYDGVLQPVADTLVRSSSLEADDPEFPDPQPMLASLVLGRPLVVAGQLLAPDEPQAVLYLEMLVTNWLLRTAELIALEVLSCSSGWPELRRYLLRPDLLPTRNLERMRNQLIAQQRWTLWFERPVALYESRRPLLSLSGGQIQINSLTEPRDAELRQLGWLQQLVTLMLETRDALGPQLRRLIKSLGDLVGMLLTRVIGQAIGLVGRGILQGMGRSLGKD
jgi:hypothetical protein